ncbi:MAG TPA: NADH-quinone oxidoreductase subunit L [Chloroflexia bacterium]|nr:NADH-quinone oxidoreductase subunit L [Chloroflexia bacterium]
MPDVLNLVWLIPALPLAGMLITGLFGRLFTRAGLRLAASYLATACVLLALLLSIAVAVAVGARNGLAFSYQLYTWIPSGDFRADIGFYVDGLTATMLLVVTGVASLVHIYAIGYMKDDGRDPEVIAHHGGQEHGHGESGTPPPSPPPATRGGEGGWRIAGGLQKDGGLVRFFCFLNLFVFSMLVLVLANNYLMLFVGWELVGLSSYLLIGFWYQKRDIFQDIKGFLRKDVPFEAAKKAFIVNRIGDFGFAVGIMMLFVNFGTLAFKDVFNMAPTQVNNFVLGNMTVTCLLLFMGAMGKSAQFPLHVWLPDAMAGPTPVSALIHAATMVTAGVYLVARSNPLFHLAPDAMLVVLIIGTVTALLGATIACTATDLKQIVAYSTVSQLGYMFAGLGAGMWIAAIFHLFTHAFFKGLLFLGSGSVLHGMHDLEAEGKDPQDIRWMGGLASYMPVTRRTFIIGALANAGIFPLAGFWSKDEIISGAILNSGGVIKDHAVWGAIAGMFLWVGSFLTAFYMFRLVFLVFYNRRHWDPSTVHPHESPPIMTVPLIILAGAAVVVGVLVGFPPEAGLIHQYLYPVFKGVMVEAPASGYDAARFAQTFGLQLVSLFFAALGIGLAFLMYYRPNTFNESLRGALPALYRALRMRWYFDELYDLLFVRGGKAVANGLWAFDRNVVDGAVNGVASFYAWGSGRLRHVQTGFVGNYAMSIVLGLGGVLLVVAIPLVLKALGLFQ